MVAIDKKILTFKGTILVQVVMSLWLWSIFYMILMTTLKLNQNQVTWIIFADCKRIPQIYIAFQPHKAIVTKSIQNYTQLLLVAGIDYI